MRPACQCPQREKHRKKEEQVFVLLPLVLLIGMGESKIVYQQGKLNIPESTQRASQVSVSLLRVSCHLFGQNGY